MKVRLLRPTAIKNGFYLTGNIIELQPTEANLLVSRGTAILVEESEPESEPETKEEPKKRKPGRPPKTKEDKPDIIKLAEGGVVSGNDISIVGEKTKSN